MKKITTKKTFILGLLALVIFISSYTNIYTGTYAENFLYMIIGLFKSDAIFNLTISIPIFILRFINQIAFLYFSSIMLLLFLKIVNSFKKEKQEIKFKDIEEAHYKALYVFIFDYIIRLIIMMIVIFIAFSSFKLDSINSDSANNIENYVVIFLIISYQTIIFLAYYRVILLSIKEKYKIIYEPLIVYIIIIIIQNIYTFNDFYQQYFTS